MNLKNSKVAQACATAIVVTFSGSVHAGDPKYVGDVPGRSLPESANFDGHVGLWTGSQILEMQGFGKSMGFSTLTGFKTVKYAGYYGAKGNGNTNRYAVIKAATDQKNYSPTYTIRAEYYIGGVLSGWKYNTSTWKWDKVTKQIPGAFRCDSLVNYAYKYGGVGYVRPMTEKTKNYYVSYPTEYYSQIYGYTDNDKEQKITPNLLYNSLPNTR